MGKKMAEIDCLELIRDALESNKYLSLCQIFYLRPRVFKKPDRVTTVVNSLCCLFKCTRSSLHVVADESCLVIGHVQYKQGGTTISCLAEGGTRRLIARTMGLITEMKDIGAQFILVVEKETVFQRLVEENLHIKVPCIIVTGGGQPGVATRLFVRRMRYELGLPTFALMDCDAFGIRLFSTYKYGLKTLSFDSGRLTIPDIKLLGLLPSQIKACGISEVAKLKMGENEIQNIEQLLKEEHVKINPRLEYELQKMLESGKKIELDALCFSQPFAYKTDVFVKEMIADNQWVD
ncbi:hypothetical protein RHMOL_Rhmol03G0190100 [Rhododendron molle]|uniref:Uncharacterized protein n=1 Tax=Rhododendron molle TaxID=49168 RepID=A0ACC0PII7_RHOML|nr:hypothetical protein RHMOL_Rhmol03G0190100 [Rhododendron molle]